MDALPKQAGPVLEAARAHGLELEVREFPAGTTTAAGEVRKADANQARAATGFAIGGTPPFGHPQPLEVLIDQDLTAFDEVWAAAGTPRHVFPISPPDLVRASGGVVCDVAEVLAGTG